MNSRTRVCAAGLFAALCMLLGTACSSSAPNLPKPIDAGVLQDAAAADSAAPKEDAGLPVPGTDGGSDEIDLLEGGAPPPPGGN